MFLGALNKPTADPTIGCSDLPFNLDVVDSILGNVLPGTQLFELGSDKLCCLLVNLLSQPIRTSVTLEPNLLGLTGAILEDARTRTGFGVFLGLVVGARGIISKVTFSTTRVATLGLLVAGAIG